MNSTADDGRYIPPPPPLAGPPTQPHPLSAASGYSIARHPGPVSPPHLNTALSGFTPVRAQAQTSPYPYRSPGVNLNPHTPLSPHGQVISRHSPLSPNSNSPSMAYRSTSGNTMMDYNPQQWGRGGGPVPGAYRPHTTLTVSAVPRQLDDSGREFECILCQLVQIETPVTGQIRFSCQSLVLQTMAACQKLECLVCVRLTVRPHRTLRITTSTIYSQWRSKRRTASRWTIAATSANQCSQLSCTSRTRSRDTG